MKVLKFALPFLIFAAGLIVSSTVSFAKKEYTAKEKKPCKLCHTTAVPKDGKDLTEAGKYYKEKKTLEGYKPSEKKG